MQVSEKWKLKLSYHNTISPVYSLAFKIDQKEILVVNSTHLDIYNSKDSSLILSSKRHSGNLFSIASSKKDNYFATAGADNNVIIYDMNQNKGIVKFPTKSPALSLIFSPLNPQFIACAGEEFYYWNAQQKSVAPTIVSSKILCSSWSPDGKSFAIGMINGSISVRNSDNFQEYYSNNHQVPVFTLCWSNDLLIAGYWDNSIKIHKPRENKIINTITIPAQPTNIINFQSNLILTDIAGGVYLYNDDGQLLSSITNVNEWIWSAIVSNEGDLILGLENGNLISFSLGLKPIYSIFHNTFSIRTELTKLKLQILGTDLTEPVEFVKPVQGISLSENMISIRFPDEVSAYTFDEVEGHLELTKLGRFDETSNSQTFYGFSTSYIFINEKSVRIQSDKGTFIREFQFGSPIKASTLSSCLPEMEAIIIGLEDGQVFQIFLHLRFSNLLFKHDNPIKSLSISQMKTKIAIVDDKRKCCVYEVFTGKLLFIEEGIDLAVWNELSDDLIAMSDGNNLFVKAFDMNRIKTSMNGVLVSFSGLTVSSIVNNELVQIDVSLSAAVKNLARSGNFEKSYSIAVFGSTEENWNELADLALRAREINIAIKAASHSKNVRLLHFIEMISHFIKDNKFTNDHLSAEVDAWTNNFDSAARTWMRLGENERALQMYFDLRQFDKLKQYLSGDRLKRFANQQAKQFEDMSEIELSAELYIAGGESLKAIKLLSDSNKIESLCNLSKKIDHSEIEALKLAADTLMKNDLVKEATDLLAQLDDVSSLAKVRVFMKDWNEALSLAKMHKDLLPEVFLPFARHLFEDDQYFESLVSFFIAGRVDEALKYLNILLDNSIIMNKYSDVAFFLYGRTLGLSSICESSEEAELIVESGLSLARAYSAFGRLKEDTTSPFTVREHGSSFYLSRFVVAYLNSFKKGEFKEKYRIKINDELLRGISYPEALFSLLNESENVGEYRLMRWCAEQLSSYLIPPAIQEAIDLAIIRTHGKHEDDDGECCERCGSRLFNSSEGPLLWCTECKCPLIFSSYSFKVLGLIPVSLKDVDIKSAKELIQIDPPIENNNLDLSEIIDPSNDLNHNGKVLLNSDNLLKIDPSSIIICKWKENSKVNDSFLLNINFDSLHICRGCNSIFNDIDFEQTFLDNGSCPICKTPLDNEQEGEFADNYESYSDLLKQLRDFASSVPIEF